MAICQAHNPNYDPDCYRCKLVSFGFTPSSTPTRNPTAVSGNAIEKQRDRDLPAYKRMVDQGLSPKSTVGAADVEQVASVPIEVESGIMFGKNANKAQQYQNDHGEAMQSGGLVG